MQEMITKNSARDFPSDSLRDFSQLTQRRSKRGGKSSAFRKSALRMHAADMTQSESGLQRWLAEGYHGEMDYMGKHGTRRTRPAELVPGTLRVISARMNYMPKQKTVGGDSGWRQGVHFPLCAGARLSQGTARALAKTCGKNQRLK